MQDIIAPIIPPVPEFKGEKTKGHADLQVEQAAARKHQEYKDRAFCLEKTYANQIEHLKDIATKNAEMKTLKEQLLAKEKLLVTVESTLKVDECT